MLRYLLPIVLLSMAMPALAQSVENAAREGLAPGQQLFATQSCTQLGVPDGTGVTLTVKSRSTDGSLNVELQVNCWGPLYWVDLSRTFEGTMRIVGNTVSLSAYHRQSMKTYIKMAGMLSTSDRGPVLTFEHANIELSGAGAPLHSDRLIFR